MRIARILTRLNLGGPARQALASDPLLVARGHSVRIFTGMPNAGEGDLFDEFARRGLDVVRVPGLGRGLSVAGDLRALYALRAELRAFEPDVVHTHASKAGALGRRAARVSDHAARVHSFHGHVLEGYFNAAFSKGILALERRLARESDRIVAVSHATADDLVRLKVVVDERRLVVVPPGIELAPLLAIGERGGPAVELDLRYATAPESERPGALRSMLAVGKDDVLVAVVGRLAEVKRPEWALDVFEMLAARYPRMHLVFVGDGGERGSVERRIRALAPQLQRRAHLIGARHDMLPVMSDVDVVLLTSRAEGMPIALIEAAAAGKPVVATGVGGVAEIVAHERTGFLGSSVDELAFGLAQLLDAPLLRTALGQRARTRVRARHSPEALCNRLEDIYRVVTSERACAS